MQLIVTLDAEPDTDAEDLERLTRQLRDELSELDVQANFVTGGPAPANTKDPSRNNLNSERSVTTLGA